MIEYISIGWTWLKQNASALGIVLPILALTVTLFLFCMQRSIERATERRNFTVQYFDKMLSGDVLEARHKAINAFYNTYMRKDEDHIGCYVPKPGITFPLELDEVFQTLKENETLALIKIMSFSRSIKTLIDNEVIDARLASALMLPSIIEVNQVITRRMKAAHVGGNATLQSMLSLESALRSYSEDQLRSSSPCPQK